MKEKLIKAYIKQLTKEDIIKFSKKNNISLQAEELEIIYKAIKTDSNEILNNPKKFLETAKVKLQPTTYNKLYELYTIYYPKLYH